MIDEQLPPEKIYEMQHFDTEINYMDCNTLVWLACSVMGIKIEPYDTQENLISIVTHEYNRTWRRCIENPYAMNVLVACEFSGRVRDAFIERGHNAYSCDLLPSEGHYKTKHYHGDIKDIINSGYWDLLIAHPPCTYLANSGVRWLHSDPSRWAKLNEASEFFNMLLHAPITKKCIENPVMHKYARERIGVKYTQIIQPWMFGHTEKKGTCLWLKNLPPLLETNNVKEEMLKLPAKEQNKIHYMSPGKDRGYRRSITYTGIAQAMAKQWG